MSGKGKKSTRVDIFRALTLRLLGTVDGMEWLNMLKEDYLIKLPVALPGKDSSFAFHREGQNSMIRFIDESSKKVKK